MKSENSLLRTIISLPVRPLTWTTIAVLIGTVFVVLHLLGWRSDTSIISGTVPMEGVAGEMAIMRGVAYALVWFTFIIVSPILLIAAVLRAVFVRVIGERTKRAPASTRGY